MERFELSSVMTPAGDQPKAIASLTDGVLSGQKHQTLLGVTGSGKTFTVANVVANVQKPTLVIAHNKTLAAQLAQEFRLFFPKNAVEYFVSYYDYYQPEAYNPISDTYIEKETQINEEIDRLRHAATAAVLSRRDVIIVASVSCIYGLGSPDFYRNSTLTLCVGALADREELVSRLVEMHYERSEFLERGRFRTNGGVIDVVPAGGSFGLRVVLSGNTVSSLTEYDLTTGETIHEYQQTLVYPAKHFVVPEPLLEEALLRIEKEMIGRVSWFRKHDKLLEAQRLEQKTKQDLEMMRELGYCSGIENYSRYLTGRKDGESPYTLMDYFPEDYLLVVDESHVTLPQVGGMYYGDRARKTNLIENGFRLPSAYDNRPLQFEEFEGRVGQAVYVSATPGKYEHEHSSLVVEQIIRPTGLVDPELVMRPTKGQVRDVMEEIKVVVSRGERVLITTLTKKQAEDLSEFLKEHDVSAEYLHSNVETLDRIRILEELRRGDFDVLVGVNLLREGLDLPEVSLVGILDADKEGFLRSETSLIQTIGRAARHVSGRVILYADSVTGSMRRAIDETERRRLIQIAYNKEYGITPQSIKKNIQSIVDHEVKIVEVKRDFLVPQSGKDLAVYVKNREKEMKEAARKLDFERAAIIRDEIKQLRQMQVK
ncbi:MAG: excinuclease ABC subunit UvrB [Candidatus Moranbacteria bacterium]|nr:excinuclease ABC subunit UvrB [Candidatus Moranbacteria bacterium]